MEAGNEKAIIDDDIVTANTDKKEKHIKKPDIYSCDICGRTCASKSHLTVHGRFHNGEKPFSCDKCEKSFSVKSSLTKHKLIHLSDNYLTCKICTKIFSRKKILLAHMRTHTNTTVL